MEQGIFSLCEQLGHKLCAELEAVCEGALLVGEANVADDGEHLGAFLGSSPLEELFQCGKAICDILRIASADLGIGNVEELHHGIRRSIAVVKWAIL